MRVILEVTSGPRTGRRVQLDAGQELRVGRTDRADFTLAEDARMSGNHFQLQADASGCSIQDLGSTNGTHVNGQRIAGPLRLEDGDEILAGQTQFVVRLGTPGLWPAQEQPSLQPAVGSPPPVGTAAGRPPQAVDSPRAGGIEGHYSVEPCESGLMLCRGTVAEVEPAVLAEQLGRTWPAYFLVDFCKLGITRPAGLAAYLFDWLDPPAAAMVSPVFFSAADYPEWPAVMAEAWGGDALVAIFSRQEPAAVLEHLRQSLRGKGRREDSSGGMLGFCWPSVMALLLAHGPARTVSPLLAGIDAVLVELPDLPETWQVYGARPAAEALERMGLVRRDEAALV